MNIKLPPWSISVSLQFVDESFSGKVLAELGINEIHLTVAAPASRHDETIKDFENLRFTINHPNCGLFGFGGGETSA
jgi:hypothetical protein